jgi:hypothetical protein
MSDETIYIWISRSAHELLVEIKIILKKKGRYGREASFKRIIEEALKDYKKKLDED